MKRKALRAAFPHTLPVLTGYAFLGLAYGILMQSAGFPFWYPALISLVVYAGSMQYAAVPLLGAAFDPAGAFFLTLMVNARHLFYGVSMLEPYRAAGKKTPYLVFAMSDETFSVNVSACPPEGVDRGWFMFWVSLLDQFYWVAASALGGLLGRVLTVSTKGIEFVMTALFVTIFTGQWMEDREHRPALVRLRAVVSFGFWGGQFYSARDGAYCIAAACNAARTGQKGGGTMTTAQSLITIGIIALGTVFTRFLPFWLFPKGKPAPRIVAYLGKVLPCAVMGLLVVYCLKDVQPAAAPYGLPELIAVAATAGLHVWKKNTLLSVGVGTVLYMLLVQLVFV